MLRVRNALRAPIILLVVLLVALTGCDVEPPDPVTTPVPFLVGEYDDLPELEGSSIVEEVFEDIPLEEIAIVHGCVVKKGPRFQDAMNMGSAINTDLVDAFSHLAMDILFVVDEERTVFKIAETVGRRVENVIEVVQYCVSKHITKVECPEDQESGPRETVEFPLYEGELGKAKKDHRFVLELCDGTRTVHDIADQLGILYFNALQSIVPYRGKTLRFIRKDKVLGE